MAVRRSPCHSATRADKSLEGGRVRSGGGGPANVLLRSLESARRYRVAGHPHQPIGGLSHLRRQFLVQAEGLLPPAQRPQGLGQDVPSSVGDRPGRPHGEGTAESSLGRDRSLYRKAPARHLDKQLRRPIVVPHGLNVMGPLLQPLRVVPVEIGDGLSGSPVELQPLHRVQGLRDGLPDQAVAQAHPAGNGLHQARIEPFSEAHGQIGQVQP